MFLHYGINTFNDCEWSDGSLPLSSFRPSGYHPDAWCEAAREAGCRLAVFTTKHIDGFCNWPTATTGYGVAATGFGRDPVGEFVEAARRHGLAVGFYYALWDRREPRYADDSAYADYVLSHLDELLTRYGSIAELWFDGAWMKFAGCSEAGPQVADPASLIEAWAHEGSPRWRWDRIYRRVHDLQPDCVVLNNATTRFPGVPLGPVDACCGEKALAVGLAARPDLPLQIEMTLSRQGPPGFFADGSWFWHAWDRSTPTDDELGRWLTEAESLGAVLLLNASPGPDGHLRCGDLDALRRLAKRGSRR